MFRSFGQQPAAAALHEGEKDIQDAKQTFQVANNAKDLGYEPFEKDECGDKISSLPKKGKSVRSSIVSIGESFRGLVRGSVTTSFRSWLVFGDDMDTSNGPTERSRRSMLRWANMRRYSSTRERVSETSHYIATSKLGITLEKALIPVTPKTTEQLVTFLLCFSLFFVIPFGVTRVRTGRWTGYFFNQACINWVLKMLGFDPMFGGDTKYLSYGTDEQNPTRPGIDLAFAIHLSFGVLWIIFGGLQYVL